MSLFSTTCGTQATMAAPFTANAIKQTARRKAEPSQAAPQEHLHEKK